MAVLFFRLPPKRTAIRLTVRRFPRTEPRFIPNRPIYLFAIVLITSACQRTDDSAREASQTDDPDLGFSAIPIAHAEPADLFDLRLRLEAGDRFPLIKRVRQSVVQQSNTGETTAETDLELHLVLKVEGASDESVVFNVQDTRVKFTQDGLGRRAIYDSSHTPDRIPFAAVPFAGLVGNGYSVGVGRDNQIIELTGHDEFLERCIAGVPAERRQNLMNEIAVRFGDEGVAGFIPDTIGLLPFDGDAHESLASRVQKGDSWHYERQLNQTLPVHLRSTCRIVRVSPNQAEIDIAGRVTPGKTYMTSHQVHSSSVNICGGSTMGVCIVDRQTGLPSDVQRTELLQVEVSGPDGKKVRQDKRIETTVRLFPTERGPVVQSPSPPHTTSDPYPRRSPRIHIPSARSPLIRVFRIVIQSGRTDPSPRFRSEEMFIHRSAQRTHDAVIIDNSLRFWIPASAFFPIEKAVSCTVPSAIRIR